MNKCLQVKKHLELIRDNTIKDIKGLSKDVLNYFAEHGLKRDYFLRGTYYNHFINNLDSEDDKRWNPSKSLKSNILNNKWYAKVKSQEIKNLLDNYEGDLENFYSHLINLLSNYNSVKAILSNIYSIAILNELIIEVKAFKKENNIEQISEFNKKINKVVINQPSAFIYERLGERYNHYLMTIQELFFLQWKNILPLI